MEQEDDHPAGDVDELRRHYAEVERRAGDLTRRVRDLLHLSQVALDRAHHLTHPAAPADDESRDAN